MIRRTLFSPEHEDFRASFRKFLEKEVIPHHEAWEERGYVDREVWQKAGKNGFLCPSMPEPYGGAGADRLYSMVMMEETAKARTSGLGFSLHSEIVAPYLLKYGTDEQKANYLPRMARGEIITAIAMSEPGVGSDLQSVKTSAVKDGEGYYTVNGAKTFITNGWHADLVITVAKTNPALGAKGTSLILVERGMPGFERGKRLKKLGLKAQDTSELFFDKVKVSADHKDHDPPGRIDMGGQGGGTYKIVAPAVRAEDHGTRPYGAQVWPASIALFRSLLRGPALEGRHAVDLGCGLGLAGLGAGLSTVIIAIAVTRIPTSTRVTRSVVMATKQNAYVESAQMIGASVWRIMFRHIAPQCVGSPMEIWVSGPPSLLVRVWPGSVRREGLRSFSGNWFGP